jgi:brefeldin A-inhibited guanine nucleotide-exchange protein
VDFMSSTNKKAQQEEHHIRTLGLECLVSILQSLEISAGLNLASSTVATAAAAAAEAAARAQQNAAGEGDDDASASSSVSAAPNSPSNIVDVFDKKQKLTEELDTGILKFNLSPKTGLAYLAKAGHIEMTPKSVANFFHQYQDRLDKTSVGDYLGREREYLDGFCLKVLHEYVEVMDFTDMPFDLSIRYFLAGFRLPGEAQKIDRIMEKFAERYYLQNRAVFASADMAFILAFSTIMLQTNLHNPAIREDKRMTKEQFIKQNKGICADGELPDDLLMEIYDRIAAQPISITSEADKSVRKPKKDDQQSFVIFQATSDKLKKDAFNQERKEMVRAGEAMIKLSARRASTTFVRNSAARSDEAYARPMFDIVWPPVIGVLSQLLEMFDDAVMVQMCLTGIKCCIQFACRLDFPVARNTFINALTKFTTLDAVKEMRSKHVACIKLMMDIALSEGDFLEESWLQVLQTVSRLARLQLFASGSHTDDIFFGDSSEFETSGSGKLTGNRRSSTANDPFLKMFMGPSRAETTRLVEEANAELVMRTVDIVLVDRLFSYSVHLTGASVRHFVKCLCEVSLLELSTSSSMNSLRGKDSASDSSTPRIFSLQKLVEVADYNMFSRSRVDWSNMWSLLAQHFAMVGLHSNQNVGMYAIDSLKQLSVKFLQKDELSNFNFQRVFLMPFETIMLKTKSHQTKELVLNCIEVMIRSCASNIHSGWRTIFTTFTLAAAQEMTDIAANAFSIIDQLMHNQFDLLIYDFVELLNCLVSFVSSTHTNLSMRALDFLCTCADHLAAGKIDPAVEATTGAEAKGGVAWEKTKGRSMNEDASVFRLWWPLLLGLSTSVGDGRLKIRVKALETLQTVLRRHGGMFSPQTLSVIFKGVLFPMIDSAKTDATQQPKSAWPTENPPPSSNVQSWIGTVGASVLMFYVDIFKLYGEKDDDSVPLLPDIITALEGCIHQDTESLSKLGMSVLSSLVLNLCIEQAPVDTSSNLDSVEEAGEQEAPPTGAVSASASASVGEPIVNIVSKKRTDLICARTVKSMVSSLCLDFGDAGSVELKADQIPAAVKGLLARCPLAQRRRVKMGLPDEELENSSAASEGAGRIKNDLTGFIVATPFGSGRVAEVNECLKMSFLLMLLLFIGTGIDNCMCRLWR